MKKWYIVYHEIASQLMQLYVSGKTNTGRILFNRCFDKDEFRSRNKWIEKFGMPGYAKSLDPFHIFASISDSSLSEQLRIERINILLDILSVKRVNYSKIDFSGCPAPLSLRITSVRIEYIQQEIWEFFVKLMNTKGAIVLTEISGRYKNWYGIDITAFTIFLFWIYPERFLPLDKNTVNLFLEQGIIQKKPKNFAEYAALLKQKRSTFYREIAKNAYALKQDSPARNAFLIKLYQFYRINRKAEKRDAGNEFKLIALRPLKGIPDSYTKVLQPHQLYSFYKCYEIVNDSSIRYYPEKDIPIYYKGDFKINISAIAGKNGSGKSTISELLFRAINNLSIKIKPGRHQLDYEEELYLQLFYKTNQLYRIDFSGKSVSIFAYIHEKNEYTSPVQQVLSQFHLEQFFYTIVINYSHFALNSIEIGPWIDKLFAKNDGYQVPVVFNPYREAGNFDINVENELVISRLLANILEPVHDEIGTDLSAEALQHGHEVGNNSSLRQLTHSGKSVTHLKFSLKNRGKKDVDENEEIGSEERMRVMAQLKHNFGEMAAIEENEITELIWNYVFRKMLKICEQYPVYQKYLCSERRKYIRDPDIYESISKGYRDKYFDADRLPGLIQKIKESNSHITNKLKRAINYLRFNHYANLTINERIPVDHISSMIDDARSRAKSLFSETLETLELLPPSDFKVELILDDKVLFSSLSSGEKQEIYTVSSIVYHLLNLDSVDTSDGMIGYRSVNIILDEAELYFHPDMQRRFIHYLHRYIGSFKFENISALNICFVTHSPFIISDIPADNILFLGEKGALSDNTTTLKTFGANIHELLSHGFFLENGLVGDFARQKIQWVIDRLQPSIRREGISDVDVLLIERIIAIIGEPLLREKLLDMYYEKFPDAKAKQIKYYREKLKQLENDTSETE